jgi:hypothetical protein
MGMKEILRYTNNKDTSSVSIKQFNEKAEDNYPTFSLCFLGSGKSEKLIYNYSQFEDNPLSNYLIRLKERKKVRNRISKYQNLIKGKLNVSSEEIKNATECLSGTPCTNFSQVTMKIKPLLRMFTVVDQSRKWLNHWKIKNVATANSKFNQIIPQNSSNNPYWPFFVSYTTPNQICYTRYDELLKTSLKRKEYVALDKSALDSLRGWKWNSESRGDLYLYIHNPGQNVRNFGKEVYHLPLTTKYINQNISISVTRVDVLRSRSDAEKPCNPSIEDEDAYYMNSIVQKAGCIPPYWKSLENINADMPSCISSEQLKLIFDNLSHSNEDSSKEINQLAEVPCKKMMISTILTMKDTSTVAPSHLSRHSLFLTFDYKSTQDVYFETTNTKDFGVEGLWSSIGGFVGIFLGYSLLQITNVVIKNCLRIRSTINRE